MKNVNLCKKHSLCWNLTGVFGVFDLTDAKFNT